MRDVEWIAVDCGAETLRLWPMGAAGAVAGPVFESGARAAVGAQTWEARVLALAARWLRDGRATPLLVCGAPGLIGAAYRQVPCTPIDTDSAVHTPTVDPRLSVHIVPGLRQTTPAGVLQGEETRLAGFLAAEPGFDGVVCLAGPKSTWVHVSAGEAVSFISFMSGELFELFVTGSSLRPALAPAGLEESGFLMAVAEALSRPERLASGLLPLKAEAVQARLEPVSARSRLLGLLIGAELAAARPYWLGREVVVIGTPDGAAPYVAALSAQGVSARGLDEAEAALAGLTAAYALLSNIGHE